MSKPTPGPWVEEGDGIRTIVRGGDLTIVAVRHRLDAETHAANFALIAEAGTVHHETGLTPQQLREQRDELLAAHEMNARLLALVLHDLQGRVDASKIGAISQCLDRSRAAISKVEGRS